MLPTAVLLLLLLLLVAALAITPSRCRRLKQVEGAGGSAYRVSGLNYTLVRAHNRRHVVKGKPGDKAAIYMASSPPGPAPEGGGPSFVRVCVWVFFKVFLREPVEQERRA